MNNFKLINHFKIKLILHTHTHTHNFFYSNKWRIFLIQKLFFDGFTWLQINGVSKSLSLMLPYSQTTSLSAVIFQGLTSFYIKYYRPLHNILKLYMLQIEHGIFCIKNTVVCSMSCRDSGFKPTMCFLIYMLLGSHIFGLIQQTSKCNNLSEQNFLQFPLNPVCWPFRITDQPACEIGFWTRQTIAKPFCTLSRQSISIIPTILATRSLPSPVGMLQEGRKLEGRGSKGLFYFPHWGKVGGLLNSPLIPQTSRNLSAAAGELQENREMRGEFERFYWKKVEGDLLISQSAPSLPLCASQQKWRGVGRG